MNILFQTTEVKPYLIMIMQCQKVSFWGFLYWKRQLREYRSSSFKHRCVYLILGLIGEAFIRRRHLFQKSEGKKMKSYVNSKQ